MVGKSERTYVHKWIGDVLAIAIGAIAAGWLGVQPPLLVFGFR